MKFFPDFDDSLLLSAVYEQWLYSDLKISSQPIFGLPVDKCSKRTVMKGDVAAQVNTVIDIGTSLYSQYRELTHKFEDTSGFQSNSEKSETDSDSFMVYLTLLSLSFRRGNWKNLES
ncbi:unnamed protein product [Gongylonema pulchrum]|uniref:RecQ-mediated genome instability protein 1 n=1 Tax=Gongylonema pulchrum TaxID=637853 RepID=A0A183EY10_9BILA|nr:unnamed protein product [Gongylonema pulchrum]